MFLKYKLVSIDIKTILIIFRLRPGSRKVAPGQLSDAGRAGPAASVTVTDTVTAA